jgi:Histidine kinase/GHKL domain
MYQNSKSQHILLAFIMDKKWRWLRHLILMVALAVNIYPDVDADTFKLINIKDPQLLVAAFQKDSLALYIVSIALINLNLLVLVPKLLLKNKYLYYFAASIGVAIVYYLCETGITLYLLTPFKEVLPLPSFSVKGFIDSTITPLIFLAATSGYKIFKKWILDTRLLNELKMAKAAEELDKLKSQINPHFLFNTLNNLQTLIATNTEKASAVVLGLSDVLRYHLYEAVADKVLLKKDIAIAQQLLELEKIRRDDFQFSIVVEGNIAGVMLPPYIFTNFIENAIKHSADNRKFSYVSLGFLAADGYLHFTCKNSKPSNTESKNKTGGIGLQNIQRRLELLYNKNFVLDMQDGEKEYTVTLKLPI